MTAAVIPRYERDTSGVVSSIRSPCGRVGATSISAVTYWLLTSPRIAIRDAAGSTGPCTVTGR